MAVISNSQFGPLAKGEAQVQGSSGQSTTIRATIGSLVANSTLDIGLFVYSASITGSLPTTADLVLEVSVTSLAFDRKEKASLYARAGIPEYWIVDLAYRLVEAHRDRFSRISPIETSSPAQCAQTLLVESGQKITPKLIAKPEPGLTKIVENWTRGGYDPSLLGSFKESQARDHPDSMQGSLASSGPLVNQQRRVELDC